MLKSGKGFHRRDVLGSAAILGGAVALGRLVRPAMAQTVAVPTAGQSPTIDKIRRNGVFRGGTAIGAPGLLQDPSSGQLVGPAVIIAEELARRLSVRLELVESNWNVIIAGLQSDRFDVAIAPLLTTPARLEVVDIIPYYVDGLCYSVLRDNPKTASITNPEQLNDPRINFSTAAGSAGEARIRQRFTRANLRSVQIPPGGSTATDEVLSGRADVVSQNSSQARVITARYPQLRLIPDVEECIRNPDFEVPVGMAIPKGDRVLGEFMTAVITSIRPQIDAAIQRYTSPEFMIRR